jgi:hypothetical protein
MREPTESYGSPLRSIQQDSTALLRHDESIHDSADDGLLLMTGLRTEVAL